MTCPFSRFLNEKALTILKKIKFSAFFGSPSRRSPWISAKFSIGSPCVILWPTLPQVAAAACRFFRADSGPEQQRPARALPLRLGAAARTQVADKQILGGKNPSLSGRAVHRVTIFDSDSLLDPLILPFKNPMS